MSSDSKLLPCPFCGSKPTFGYTKKTGCQLHGDPIQYVTLGCKKCEFKPGIVGGCRYRGSDTPKYENDARSETIEKWNTRATTPTTPAPTEDEVRKAIKWAEHQKRWFDDEGDMGSVLCLETLIHATLRPAQPSIWLPMENSPKYSEHENVKFIALSKYGAEIKVRRLPNECGHEFVDDEETYYATRYFTHWRPITVQPVGIPREVVEALSLYADKEMWLGEMRDKIESGKWQISPVAYLWRGFQGDDETDHPADTAREALALLSPHDGKDE